MAELNSYRPGSTIQSNPAGGLRMNIYDQMLEERDALQQELSLPSPIQVSADEYRFLSTSLAGLEGKQRDEMKYRLGSAMAFSRNLGITVEQAYAALPALTKAQLDIEYKPDSTTFRSLQDSLAIGVISAGLTDKYNQYKDAYLRGDDVSAIDAEIQRLNGEIETRQDNAPRWITTKMLQMSLQNIPFMADVFMEGAESYMRAASIGQGMALAAGLVGGPATLATAEVGTQIVSIAAAISTIARVWTTKEWTAGEQFYELVNQGADPTAAAAMSEFSGWMQGLIEESGGPLTSLNKALGMANKTPREFASKLSAYLFLKGKTCRFIRDIGRSGVDVAAEGFEEVQQQFVDDVTDAITYTLSDMEIPEGNWTTPEEYAEAFAGGVGVAAVLGVAPSIITSRIEGRQAQTINALAQSGLSEGQFTAVAKSVLPEDITEHASEEDINGLLHTVYENNKDKRDKSVLNREGIRTRVQETDKNPEDVNQETAEPTPSIDDEPMRLPSGIYRINGMDEREAEHVPSGGTRLKATVTDPSGKLVYADITYIRKGNNIDIQGIDITEGEHLQTEGFRDDILRQFASMYPDYNVTFSNPRFSAESDSLSRVIASNPRGQQYGLNFGLDFSEEDRAGVRERIKLFNFGGEQKSAAVRLIQMLGAAEGKTGVEFFDSRFQGTITEEEFARLFPEEYAKAQAGGGMNAAYIPSSRVPDSLRSASDMGNSVRGILVAGRNANPTSFEHEVIHALMQDKEKQDSFSDIFAKEINGQKKFWDFVHKSDLYKDSGVKENFDYIEAHPELFQKGAQWGARQHEFVARLEEMYRLSGQSTRPELRGFFQRLTDFFRRIYDALKQEGALSDEIVAYFDSFFGTPEDLQKNRGDSMLMQEGTSNDVVYASTNAEAKEILKAHIGENIVNSSDGTIARYGTNGLNKLISNAAKSKSVANGFTAVEHLTAVANTPLLFRESRLLLERPDNEGHPDLIIRYYGANVAFDGNGKHGIAQILVKINTNHPNTIYTMELVGLTKESRPIDGSIDSDGSRRPDHIASKGGRPGNRPFHTDDSISILPSTSSSGNKDELHVDTLPDTSLQDADASMREASQGASAIILPSSPRSDNVDIDAILRQEPISAAEFDEFRRRLLSDPDNFDADGNPLAPNGERSNLTLEQWITVRTPEFKAWFGDWELDPENASKVVDENGEPRVVYHGTGARFSEFSYDELGSREGSFFFAQNIEDAQGYSSGIIMPVFLNLRNPISFDDIPAEVFDATENKAEMVEWSKQNGYDGWMTDMDDGWGELSAFYPNQIKSATRNNGQFDAENPDIYFQLSDDMRASYKKIAFADAIDEITAHPQDHTIAGEKFQHGKPASSKASKALFRSIAPRGVFTNRETDIKADFGRTYIDEISGHDWSNEAHLASIMAVPRIYENALHVGKFKDGENRLFDYFFSIFDYDGTSYLVRSAVREGRGNEFYYDHKLSELSKIKDWASSGFRLSTPGLDSSNPSIIEDTRLQRFLQGDISDKTELVSSPFIARSSMIKSADKNSGAFSPESNDIYYQLSPEYVRENMDYETKMPTDEAFFDAVRNTPSASIVDDGIIVDIERWQKPEQDNEASVRTGVFYLPRGASQSRYYRGGTGFYGGAVHFTGETLLKAPLAVKGATGGNVPLKAYEALFGKEAAKKLEEDCESIMRPYQRSAKANRAMDVYYEYLPDADNDYMDFSLLEINSREGNQLRYAVQENIIAHAVREAGYDSVIGYNRGKLTEIFDVREGNYPSELSSDPWATYIPNDPEKILFQTPSEQQAEAKAKLERLLSASDDEVLREIGRGREFVFNTDVEEALTDIRSIVSVSKDYDEFVGFMEAVRDGSSLDAATRRRLRRALRKRLAGERAEVTVPPEAILNDTGDYIDTYQMLRTEQESSEDLSAPVSNDIQGVLGADERENAITGDGDENGEVEDTALRRAMETGEEKREDGETERVIRESDETIRRIDEEQAELESQLAEAEDELSAEDRKAARQEAVIENLIRQSDAKDAVRGFPQGHGDDPARIINRREYIRMWKEFLHQKDRDYIKFWTDYVKTLEKEERDAIKAGRKRSEEEYVQWWDEIIRRQDEKYYRNAAREAKRIREAYISWWKKKLDQEAARTSRREAVERTKAKYKAIIKKMEENQRAKDKARRERQQALRIKRYKESLASRIMRKVSANTELSFAEKIYAIQALMTEDDRQNLIIGGERWSVELLREMFRDTPNDPMFSALRPGMLDILTKKRPSDFTVEELENLLDAVNELRREGLRAWQAVVDARAAANKAIVRNLMNTLAHSSHYDENEPMPGSEDERRRLNRPWTTFIDITANIVNMERIAQILDNGKPDGPFHQILIEEARRAQDAEERAVNRRLQGLMNTMKENKVKPSDLMRGYIIQLDNNKEVVYSFDKLVHIYYGSQNEKNRQAIAYGEFVSSKEKDDFRREAEERYKGDPDAPSRIRDIDGRPSRWTIGDQRRAYVRDRVIALGDSRFANIMPQIRTIIAENPGFMAVYDYIMADLGGESFGNVQKVLREEFNLDISKEDFYIPIIRLETDQTYAEKRKEEAMIARTIATEASSYVTGMRVGFDKGFTNTRQEITPEKQKPIKMGLLAVYIDHVRSEEHLVHSLAYSRKLDAVFNNQSLRNRIRFTYGSGMLKAIDSYRIEIRNPAALAHRESFDRVTRFLRGNVYSSYLGFRPRNMLMQAVTSPLPFLAEGVTPAEYMAQLFRYMSSYGETWDMITELSPMMAGRSFDLGASLLADERLATKLNDMPEAARRLREFTEFFQKLSLEPLNHIDRAAVSAGWLAIYEKEMKKNGGDKEASARAADAAVLRSQPVQRRTEMSPLFRSDNEWLRFFTQFTSSLNVVFQHSVVDTYFDLKNHQWGKAMARIGSYALAGALLFLIDGKLRDDDDDDGEEEFQWRRLIYSFFSQQVDSIPIIADGVESIVYPIVTGDKARLFFGSDFPPLDRLSRAVSNATDGEWLDAFAQALTAIGITTGIPTLAIEDFWDAFVSITQGEAPESLWR